MLKKIIGTAECSATRCNDPECPYMHQDVMVEVHEVEITGCYRTRGGNYVQLGIYDDDLDLYHDSINNRWYHPNGKYAPDLASLADGESHEWDLL